MLFIFSKIFFNSFIDFSIFFDKSSKYSILFLSVFFFSSFISSILHTSQFLCMPFPLLWILLIHAAQHKVLWFLQKYSKSFLCFSSWQIPENIGSISLAKLIV